MKVFLSFASPDRSIAQQIQLALLGDDHVVFFDEASLPAGGDYNSRIRDAIDECDAFVYLVSPHSVGEKRYQHSELSLIKKKWPKPWHRVLPVMISPVEIEDIDSYLRAVTLLQPSGNVPVEVAAAIESYHLFWRARNRWKTLVMIGALLLVACLLYWRGLLPGAAKKPASAHELTVSIKDVDGTKPSEKTPPRSNSYAGDDKEAIVGQAAEWIKHELEVLYPRDEPTRDITVSLDLSAKTVKVDPPDPNGVRRVHFWMFKKGEADIMENEKEHPTTEKANAAVDEAIQKGERILVHIDQPGYELKFVEFKDYANGDSTELKIPETLTKRSQPELVVMFAEQAGSEMIAELLRGQLNSVPGLYAGSPDEYQDRQQQASQGQEYQRSFGNRQTKLKESRVDALITVTYADNSVP